MTCAACAARVEPTLSNMPEAIEAAVTSLWKVPGCATSLQAPGAQNWIRPVSAAGWVTEDGGLNEVKHTANRRSVGTMVGFAVLVFFLAAYAQAAQLEPPKAVGELQLAHALRGEEALQAIDRLHGKGLAATDAYVAHYERNGLVAMLYVSRPARSPMAGAQVEKMAAGIRAGKTPFSQLKSDERNGTTVYSAVGEGQNHYFYRRGKDVIWIAADPPVAKEVLESLLRRKP